MHSCHIQDIQNCACALLLHGRQLGRSLLDVYHPWVYPRDQQ